MKTHFFKLLELLVFPLIMLGLVWSTLDQGFVPRTKGGSSYGGPEARVLAYFALIMAVLALWRSRKAIKDHLSGIFSNTHLPKASTTDKIDEEAIPKTLRRKAKTKSKKTKTTGHIRKKNSAQTD